MTPTTRRRCRLGALVFAGVAAVSVAGSVAPAGATTNATVPKQHASPVVTVDGHGTYATVATLHSVE
jgi:hypothetical protein